MPKLQCYCALKEGDKKENILSVSIPSRRRSKNNKSPVLCSDHKQEAAQGLLQLQNIWELVALRAVCYCLQSQLLFSS